MEDADPRVGPVNQPRRNPGLPAHHEDGGEDLPELGADIYYYRFKQRNGKVFCFHCGNVQVSSRLIFYHWHWEHCKRAMQGKDNTHGLHSYLFISVDGSFHACIMSRRVHDGGPCKCPVCN